MNIETCYEIFSSFIDNIHENRGWWYTVNFPGKKHNDATYKVFPHINTIFGLHSDAMVIFWLESGFVKRAGERKFRMNNDWYEKLKDKVLVRNSIELSTVNLGGTGSTLYMKLGNINLSARNIWNMKKKNELKKHPPRILASREATKIARNNMIEVIKSSADFNNMLKLYLSLSFENKRRREEQNEVIQADDKIDSSSSEEEFKEAAIIKPSNPIEAYKIGTPADSTTAPVMSLFKIPVDNTATLERLHFELTKHLQKNNIIAYQHPLHTERKIEQERKVLPTARELLKEEYKVTHNL